MSRNTIISVVLIIVALVAGYLFAVSREPNVPNSNTNTSSSTPIGGSENENKKFTVSYLSGFEGYNFRINAEVTYPAPQFEPAQDIANKSEILLKEGNRVHTIRILNNDGPGFQNSEEAFEGAFRSMCDTCTKVTNTFDISKMPGASDLATFANPNAEVLVMKFNNGGFYVAALLLKPTQVAERVLETFRFSAERTNESPY